MVRTYSTAVQGEIDKQFAGEPMVIIEVSWNGDSWVAYSDRKLNGADYPHPYIISTGEFDSTTVVSGGSYDQNVAIILNDIDGSIREIINTQDIHLRPVRLYLTFQGLPLSEKALIMEGVINSPIVWDESGRTLQMDVLSKLEDAEVGFTMEDGDFPYVPDQERNQPWPMVFGQVCNMQTAQVTSLRKGYLAEGVGIPDPTLQQRLCQIQNVVCPYVADEQFIPGGSYYIGNDLYFKPDRTIPIAVVDVNCLFRRYYETCKILTALQQQQEYVKDQFEVTGGENFPQNQTINLKIGDVKFRGVMNGTTFSVANYWHPNYENDNPVCRGNWSNQKGIFRTVPDGAPTSLIDCGSGFDSSEYGRWKEITGDVKDRPEIPDGNLAGYRSPEQMLEFAVAIKVWETTSAAAASWDYYSQFKSYDFIYLYAREEVFLLDDLEDQIVHIVSLIPGVVDQVAAYRTYGETTILTDVPTEYYAVHTTDFNGYDVTEIRLSKKLSSIENEEWEDEIYVSVTSTVGPNPADEIQWLVEKYTDYTVDAASFAAVKASLTNYPSNFALKSRDKVLDVIRDIAYQARCAVYVRDNTVYITYLSLEPTSVVTLTEADILQGTFKFSHTPTEDLETRHDIKWQEAEAGVFKEDKTEFDFVLKNNVPQYGIFDSDYDYYTYNVFELVQKSATFWLIRKAKTWRYVEFQTSVKHLNLDVFDCVTLNIAQFPTTKIVIEESNYNAESNTVSFKAWTPILSGQETPYYWAWPSQQSANAVFPLVEDADEGGDGSGISVIPPPTHPLFGGYDPESNIQTNGDRNPSDLDDSLPTIVCKISTADQIAELIEPDFKEVNPLAERNFSIREGEFEPTQASLKDSQDGETPEDEPEKEDRDCGTVPEDDEGCVYQVNVTYVTPTTVTTNPSPTGVGCGGGPCTGSGSGDGVCTGPTAVYCHHFSSLFAAQSFRDSKQAEADACGFTVGETRVYLVSNSITAIAPPSGGCDDVNSAGDPNAPGADAGETSNPGFANGDPSVSPPS